MRPSLQGTNDRLFVGAQRLCIAMNHVELTAWSTESKPKLSSVKNPVETVPIADAGLIRNLREKDLINGSKSPIQPFYWRLQRTWDITTLNRNVIGRQPPR
jgi:hypothetical protein